MNLDNEECVCVYVCVLNTKKKIYCIHTFHQKSINILPHLEKL